MRHIWKVGLGLLLLLAIIAVIFGVIMKPKAVDPYPVGEEKSENFDELSFMKRNFVAGGPPKDGIPSIDAPRYVSPDKADISPDDKIYGVDYQGFTAAYPQDILYWHEIVNEEVKGEKISVTYCPLTESVIGYKGHELGVSGSLYNSNLVMYDRKTDARIPQIAGVAVEGPIMGKELETFPVEVTTWEKWKAKHPKTKVLSRETGFNRDYGKSPYPGYHDVLRVWFPLTAKNDSLETKERILGIENDGAYLAIEQEGFQKAYPEGLEVRVGNESMRVVYNEQLANLEVIEGNPDKVFEVFWFAWYAYHPETELIKT